MGRGGGSPRLRLAVALTMTMSVACSKDSGDSGGGDPAPFVEFIGSPGGDQPVFVDVGYYFGTGERDEVRVWATTFPDSCEALVAARGASGDHAAAFNSRFPEDYWEISIAAEVTGMGLLDVGPEQAVAFLAHVKSPIPSIEEESVGIVQDVDDWQARIDGFALSSEDGLELLGSFEATMNGQGVVEDAAVEVSYVARRCEELDYFILPEED